MKKLLVLLFVSFIALSNMNAANYKLDNAKVDAMFETADLANMSVVAQGLMLESGNSATVTVGEKDPIVSAVLAFFLGGFGIHRFYLGTKPLTGIGYILTCGGIFGIVPFIDFIVLLIDNKDISKYVNNPKFFMWQ